MDSKFGKQFVAQDYRETLPATVEGIEKYLGSGLVKGIGPAYAKRIVQRFQEDTLRVLEEEADYLVKVEGIGQKRVDMIKKAWQEQKEIKNVMLFLQSNGVSTAYTVKIFKTYGNESIEIVKSNPYKLADDIWGIGFKTADKIALQMGFDKNSYERCQAGIVYVLNALSNDGHCYGTREQLLEESEKILEQEISLVDSTLDRLIKEKTVILDEGDAIFLLPFYHSELGIAKRMKAILAVDNLYPTANVEGIVDNRCYAQCNGGAGAVNLNAVLQEALNPSTTFIKYGGTVYRRGDRVMQIKNNYDKNVFNGDIGSITKMDTEDRTLAINFDGTLVEYDATELDEVVLAYATTIHKSQGSEYKIVVAPLTLQHYVMLQRNLLYTCVTI
jgi:ATP-dependent exoDNAse (exonuclease V) alpha subunit